jgi:hypothetical protein
VVHDQQIGDVTQRRGRVAVITTGRAYPELVRPGVADRGVTSTPLSADAE